MKIRKGSRSKIPFLVTLIVSVAFTFGFAHQAVAARLIDESFEANPGYDESWNESVGTGCTLDEDSAIPGTAPPGAGSQCLQSISASTGYKAFAVRNLDDYFSTTYTRVYIYIDSYNSTAIKDIFRTQYMNGSSAERVWRLMVDDNGTTLKFQIKTGSTNGTTYSASIYTGQWYRVEIKYDIPGGAWEWRIDGTTQTSGGFAAGRWPGIQKWLCGMAIAGQQRTGTTYFDLVAVDDTDWVGEEAPDPGEPVWENFEDDTGYDQLGWTEVIDAGGTLTAGAPHPGTPPPVGSAPPGGSGIKTLKTVTSGLADAYAEQIKVDVGTAYVRCYLYLDEEGFNNNELITATGLYGNDGAKAAALLQIGRNSGGVLILRLLINDGGTGNPVQSTPINLDQWYYVDFKYEINYSTPSDSQWSLTVDGIQGSGDFTAVTEPNTLRVGAVAETGTAGQCVLYTDYVGWSNKQISYYVDKDSGSSTGTYDNWVNATTTISGAVTKWENKSSPNPGTIVVRKSATEYVEGSGITMRNYLDIVSEDPTDRPHMDRSMGGGPAVGFIGPISNCTLDGLKITGGVQASGSQISMNGASGLVVDVTVQNCVIEGGTKLWPTAAGIRLEGAAAPTVRYTEIYNSTTACITTGSPAMGDPLRYAGDYLTIQGCKIHDANGQQAGGGAGIMIWADNNEVKLRIGGDGSLSNEIYSHNQAGIRLESLKDTSDVVIDNNDIYENGRTDAGAGGDGLQGAGIWLNDARSATITRNDIHDNIRAGIVMERGTTATNVTIGAAAGIDDTIENIQSLYGNNIYNNFAGISFGRDSEEGSAGPAMKGNYVIRGNDIFSGTGAGENQRAAIVLRAALTSGLVLIKQNKLHDNDRAGIGIQKDYTGIQIVENNIYNNTRGGIHTGVANSFKGTNGGAIVLIEKNRVHHNVSASYGGGIDVRHASGVIENNLVYGNSRGGIRFGDYVTEIINNTVANNGQNGVGGGIIYDDLAGAVNAQPGGTLNDSPNFPPDPLIRNNISAFNEKTGLRCGGNGYGCPENPDYPGDPLGDKYRDFNLLYSNNGTGAYDCRWDASYPDKRCVNKNYGGCGLDGSWNKYNPNDIMADPRFGDGDNIYTLKSDSPAKNAGDDGNDLGAYGGSDPMDDSKIPAP